MKLILSILFTVPLIFLGQKLTSQADALEELKADAPEELKTDAPEELKADKLENLKLPGIEINLKERAIDVTSSVCLHEGSLEFIACTKDTKEHESIIRVEAKPSHIHTALLLLGAKNGNPAMRKMIGDEKDQRWIDIPPRGAPIGVFLVTTDKEGKQTERPISAFISKIDYDADPDGEVVKKADDELKTFLFAGSHLFGKEGVPKTYLADNSGSVISLSTFGDELLCLPGVHQRQNHALQWELNSEHLPKIGTEVILRLRPQIKKEEPQK